MDQPGDVTKVAQRVGQDLAFLSEKLNASQATTDADRQQMAQIMESYIDLVEKKLGQSEPGQDMPEEEGPEVDQPIPMTAGKAGVPMGPNNRQ